MADGNVDIITLLKIMWRRWFVVLPVLVLAAVAGFVLLGDREVRYSAEGTVLLMVSRQTSADVANQEAVDPVFGSALLATALEGPDVKRQLRGAGLSSAVDATFNADSGVVTVTVSGDDGGDVAAAARLLIEIAPETLEAAIGPRSTASQVRVVPLVFPAEEAIVGDDGARLEFSFLVHGSSVENPFPPASSTLVTLTELARRSDVAEAVLTSVPSGSYAVRSENRPAAPILMIRAEAATVEEVPRVYALVVEQLSVHLEQLQSNAGVPPSEQTVLTPLVPPAGVAQTAASVVRPAAALALLGVGAACAAAVVTDLVIRRRALKRADIDDGD